jgi:heme/copper-type cytochrome/quinol oxidase subunit 2
MYFATPNRLYFPRVSIDPTKPEKRVSGKWTVFTTWFLLVCFAWFSGGFSDFFYIAKNFLQGDLQAARNHDSISNMVPTIIATVAILFVVIFVLILAHMRGSSQKTEENIFETISPKRQFAVIMTTLTAEELIRQIFLGWLTKVQLSLDYASLPSGRKKESSALPVSRWCLLYHRLPSVRLLWGTNGSCHL